MRQSASKDLLTKPPSENGVGISSLRFNRIVGDTLSLNRLQEDTLEETSPGSHMGETQEERAVITTVHLRREVGLMGGIALIVGNMIGG